jgi:hypothetical protein
LGDAPSARGV